RDKDTLQAIATGIFADPNDLAATMVAGLALVLARARTGGTANKMICYLLAAGLIGSILLTMSRGGLVALAAVLGGTVIDSLRRKCLGIAAAAVLVAHLFCS